jgi:hypothetical protein
MGQRDVFVGAYAENGAGRVLLVTDRGYATENFSKAAANAPALILRNSLISQNECQASHEPPEQATLLTANGAEFHLQSLTQMPSFEWVASPSANLAFEIAEFQVGNDFTFPVFFNGGVRTVEKIAPPYYLGSKDGISRWRVISVNKCGGFVATPYQRYSELLEFQNIARAVPIVSSTH